MTDKYMPGVMVTKDSVTVINEDNIIVAKLYITEKGNIHEDSWIKERKET